MFGSNKNVTEIIIQGNNQGARKAIAQTLGDLDRADREIGKMGRGLGNVFGGIGEFVTNPLAMMGGAAIAAAGGFGALLIKAANTANELNNLSVKSGLAVDNVSALKIISEQTSIPIEDLVFSFKNGNERLIDMVTNLKDSGQAMSSDFVNGAVDAKREIDNLMRSAENFTTNILGDIASVINYDIDVVKSWFGDKENLINDEMMGYDAWILKNKLKVQQQNEETAAIRTQIEEEKRLAEIKQREAERRQREEAQRKAKFNTWVKRGLEGADAADPEIMAWTMKQEYFMQMMEVRKVALEEFNEFELNLQLLSSEQSANMYGMMGDAMMSFYQTAGQQNRIFFDLWKAFALAKAIVSGKEAVLGAYASGAEMGGPVLGAIYAAIAGIFAASQIAAIVATQPGSSSFSGGGGAPSASAISTPRESRGGSAYNTTVNIYGTLSDDDYARKLLPTLQKAYRDGAGTREGWKG